jgi:hypothetical protein
MTNQRNVWQEVKRWFYFHYYPARICLWLLRWFYRRKDEYLSALIHETAGEYQTRPTLGWIAPSDWKCWQDVKDGREIHRLAAGIANDVKYRHYLANKESWRATIGENK